MAISKKIINFLITKIGDKFFFDKGKKTKKIILLEIFRIFIEIS